MRAAAGVASPIFGRVRIRRGTRAAHAAAKVFIERSVPPDELAGAARWANRIEERLFFTPRDDQKDQ